MEIDEYLGNKRFKRKRLKKRIFGVLALSITVLVAVATWAGVFSTIKPTTSGTSNSEPFVSYDISSRDSGGEHFVIPKIFKDEASQEKLEYLAEAYPDLRDVLKAADQYEPEVFEFLLFDPEPELITYLKGLLTTDHTASGFITESEMEEKYPLFLQYDVRWGYYPYGNSMVGDTACGPTSLSMVVAALTRNFSVTPDVVAQYAMDKGHYLSGAGTSWNLFTQPNPYGVKGKNLNRDLNSMKEALDRGSLIIVSVGPGDFTKRGHLFVIVGYDGDEFIIRDPSSRSRSSKLWAFDTIKSQSLSMWEMSLED